MKLKQSFEVTAPVDRVWHALVDVEHVAPCLPGAAVTGRNDDGSYNGVFTVKIGPTSASYAGKLLMDTIDEHEHAATMHAHGSDKRGQGGAKATILSTLSPTQAGGTRVEVVTEYYITGRLARFGRSGMMEDISERLLREFARRLQATLAAPADVGHDRDEVTNGRAAAVAGLKARGEVADIVPGRDANGGALVGEDSSAPGHSVVGGDAAVGAGEARSPVVEADAPPLHEADAGPEATGLGDAGVSGGAERVELGSPGVSGADEAADQFAAEVDGGMDDTTLPELDMDTAAGFGGRESPFEPPAPAQPRWPAPAEPWDAAAGLPRDVDAAPPWEAAAAHEAAESYWPAADGANLADSPAGDAPLAATESLSWPNAAPGPRDDPATAAGEAEPASAVPDEQRPDEAAAGGALGGRPELRAADGQSPPTLDVHEPAPPSPGEWLSSSGADEPLAPRGGPGAPFGPHAATPLEPPVAPSAEEWPPAAEPPAPAHLTEAPAEAPLGAPRQPSPGQPSAAEWHPPVESPPPAWPGAGTPMQSPPRPAIAPAAPPPSWSHEHVAPAAPSPPVEAVAPVAPPPSWSHEHVAPPPPHSAPAAAAAPPPPHAESDGVAPPPPAPSVAPEADAPLQSPPPPPPTVESEASLAPQPVEPVTADSQSPIESADPPATVGSHAPAPPAVEQDAPAVPPPPPPAAVESVPALAPRVGSPEPAAPVTSQLSPVLTTSPVPSGASAAPAAVPSGPSAPSAAQGSTIPPSSEPIEAFSLVGSVLWGQIRRNPAPAGFVAGVVVTLLMRRGRRPPRLL
jgi:uncharacterized protein